MRLAAAMALVLAAATPAAAQTFPPDEEWTELPCGDGVMTDALRDESGAIDERDIVGTAEAPAGFRAEDTEFLYLRLRLDDDPAPGGALRPFSWGWELDIDGDVTTYEILVLADGLGGDGGSLVLFENTEITLPDNPDDPADQPPVASYEIAANVRAVIAGGSLFNAGDDFFLDVAIPWADLEPLGMQPETPAYVWGASSSSRQSLNADFACHNGASGDPGLSDIADPGDADEDTDGDGFSDSDESDAGTDPNNPDDFPGSGGGGAGRLEGGGGCQSAPGSGAALALLILVWLAYIRRAAKPVTIRRDQSTAASGACRRGRSRR